MCSALVILRRYRQERRHRQDYILHRDLRANYAGTENKNPHRTGIKADTFVEDKGIPHVFPIQSRPFSATQIATSKIHNVDSGVTYTSGEDNSPQRPDS